MAQASHLALTSQFRAGPSSFVCFFAHLPHQRRRCSPLKQCEACLLQSSHLRLCSAHAPACFGPHVPHLSWGVGACHCRPIQTLGAANLLGTYGIYEYSQQPNVQISIDTPACARRAGALLGVAPTRPDTLAVATGNTVILRRHCLPLAGTP